MEERRANGSAPLVSVVVPIYNTAEYLPRCLDRLVAQTLSNIEIICVDDGSTDSSPEIVERYAAENPHVVVLAQANSFAGVARNNGLTHARGEYVMFCDSDDYIALDCLEKLYERCKEDDADVCVCGGKQYFEGLDIEVNASGFLRMGRVPDKLPFSRSTNSDYLFSFGTIMTHNKMYRRAFLLDHSLEYAETRNGEDVYFSAMALWYADRITVLNQPLICYCLDRPNSLVSTLSTSALDPLREWLRVWRAIGQDPLFPKRSFDSKVVGVMRHTFRNLGSGEGCRVCFEFLRGGALDEMGICEQPAGYYPEWADSFVAHLRNDDFESFMAYLLLAAAKAAEEEGARKGLISQRLKDEKSKVSRLQKENAAQRREIERLRNTRAFRLGNALLKPFRLCGRLVRGRIAS